MAGSAPIREPMVSPKTGKVSPVWAKYFTRTINPTLSTYETDIAANAAAIIALDLKSNRRSFFYARNY